MIASTNPPASGRSLLLLGLALAPLGIGAFVLQMGLARLVTPWYVPVLAFVGAGLVAASIWRRRTAWRMLALVALLGLGGLEVLALNAMRLPAYQGPIVVGQPFPAFEARLADGSPLTQADLAGASHTAMVFFRGRW